MSNDKQMGPPEAIISGAGAGVVAANLAGLSGIPLLLKNKSLRTDLDAQESQKLREILGAKNIRVEPRASELASHFDPYSQTVRANPRSYVFGHELGHATGLMGKNKWLGTAGAFLTHNIGGPVIASAIRGMNSANKAYAAKTGNSEDHSKALDYASKLTQLGTGLQLAEECQATIRALDAIRKIQGNAGALRAAKILIPALGTYGAGAVGAHAVVPYMGRRIGEYGARNIERE